MEAYKKECTRLRDSISPARDRAGLTEAIQDTNISDVEQERHRLMTKNLSSDIQNIIDANEKMYSTIE